MCIVDFYFLGNSLRVMEDFCMHLPKAELHAHLNGSISERTLKKLIINKKQRCAEYVVPCDSDIVADRPRTLEEIFKLFPLIHEITDTTESIYDATVDVIKEFSAENVKYLELRTTPKSALRNGMTKENYVEAVIKAINDTVDANIIVKLLLSIDRKNSLSDADETVKLAEALSNVDQSVVVGIDLSGNPLIDGKQYSELLRRAKYSGLRISLHMAEVPDTIDENVDFLTLPPDRIGHGTYLLRNDNVTENVSNLKIPIEICLSSNVKGMTVDSFANHHFKYWFDKQHPLSICTDDKGLFQTTLSNEYKIAAETFNLIEKELFDISKRSLEYAFINEETKNALRTIWMEFYEKHFSNLC